MTVRELIAVLQEANPIAEVTIKMSSSWIANMAKDLDVEDYDGVEVNIVSAKTDDNEITGVTIEAGEFLG